MFAHTGEADGTAPLPGLHRVPRPITGDVMPSWVWIPPLVAIIVLILAEVFVLH